MEKVKVLIDTFPKPKNTYRVYVCKAYLFILLDITITALLLLGCFFFKLPALAPWAWIAGGMSLVGLIPTIWRYQKFYHRFFSRSKKLDCNEPIHAKGSGGLGIATLVIVIFLIAIPWWFFNATESFAFFWVPFVLLIIWLLLALGFTCFAKPVLSNLLDGPSIPFSMAWKTRLLISVLHGLPTEAFSLEMAKEQLETLEERLEWLSLLNERIIGRRLVLGLPGQSETGLPKKVKNCLAKLVHANKTVHYSAEDMVAMQVLGLSPGFSESELQLVFMAKWNELMHHRDAEREMSIKQAYTQLLGLFNQSSTL